MKTVPWPLRIRALMAMSVTSSTDSWQNLKDSLRLQTLSMLCQSLEKQNKNILNLPNLCREAIGVGR